MSQDHVRIISHDCPGVEAVMAETRHSFAKHTHEAFGIGFMYAGAQKSASGRGMVEAGAGNIITVNPREVHDGHPIGNNPRGWNMLYFDPALIARAASDLSETATDQYEFTRPVMDRPDVRRCFGALFDAIANGSEESARLRREEMLLLMLHHAMMAPGEPIPKSSVRTAVAHARIKRAKALLDDSPTQSHSLDDLAAATGLSKFQTLRDFTRATGLTPHAYLIQRRIDLARAMIKSGETLADIASSAGFADQSHLNRHFVRAFGLTPGRYARAVRAN
ncbi:AraC family transcriptional regulator [Thalassospira sp. HF15]|uniref:AraC family transcriptional regulator n=1 Tax=Thalassospira sp. HF15 TaxID=2722755 RepID=UPI001431424D|nr:AraC family transcriptional regulator [Thalassospira sp. HF15]NIY77827.1 AraC family transcriptional regulator [Thalassospira sp. HF15]